MVKNNRNLILRLNQLFGMSLLLRFSLSLLYFVISFDYLRSEWYANISKIFSDVSKYFILWLVSSFEVIKLTQTWLGKGSIK